jgi:hypothetical protein
VTVAKIDRSWGRTLDLRRDAVYLSPKLSSHVTSTPLFVTPLADASQSAAGHFAGERTPIHDLERSATHTSCPYYTQHAGEHLPLHRAHDMSPRSLSMGSSSMAHALTPPRMASTWLKPSASSTVAAASARRLLSAEPTISRESSSKCARICCRN